MSAVGILYGTFTTFCFVIFIDIRSTKAIDNAGFFSETNFVDKKIFFCRCLHLFFLLVYTIDKEYLILRYGGHIMTNQVNELVIGKVRNWLDVHNKSIQWLSGEIGVSKSLMGHILTGERQLLPDRMIQIARVMGITMDELLTPSHTEQRAYTLLLRGIVESRVAKRHLNSMLFAIDDCLRLEDNHPLVEE